MTGVIRLLRPLHQIPLCCAEVIRRIKVATVPPRVLPAYAYLSDSRDSVTLVGLEFRLMIWSDPRQLLRFVGQAE